MAGNSSSSGSSNFENATHRALYDMVAGGDHLVISFTGASLVEAGKEIEDIATKLAAYVERVPWEGEGARAFREWSDHTVKESHKLARFASATGNAISDAGTALWEAKTMPQPKQDNFVQLDSATSPTARGATGAPLMTDPDREAAVTAMNRLASYYRTAQDKIEGQEPPNFKPASGFVPDPQDRDTGRDAMYVLDQPAGSASAAGTAGGQTVSASGGSDAERHTAAAVAPVGAVQQHDQQVGTAVNATSPVTVPDTMPSQGGHLPPQPGSPGIPSGPVVPTPAAFPGAVKSPSGQRNTTRGAQPEAARPGTTRGRFGSALEDGIVGTGAPRGSTATARPQLPGGTVMGTEHGAIPPRLAGPSGASSATHSGPVTGGGAGNPGQRLRPPHAVPVDKPHGAAMGGERPAMQHGLTGSSYPGSASSTNPAVPGRRWAYEPGGTVGAAPGGSVIGGEQRPAPPGSAMGKSSPGGVVEGTASGTSPDTGRSSASELGQARGRAQAPRGRAAGFTPGGSGLARGNSTSGMLPMPGAPSTSRGGRRAAQRPDYLQEDAEMWMAQHESVVPPVIE